MLFHFPSHTNSLRFKLDVISVSTKRNSIGRLLTIEDYDNGDIRGVPCWKDGGHLWMSELGGVRKDEEGLVGVGHSTAVVGDSIHLSQNHLYFVGGEWNGGNSTLSTARIYRRVNSGWEQVWSTTEREQGTAKFVDHDYGRVRLFIDRYPKTLSHPHASPLLRFEQDWRLQDERYLPLPAH